MTRDPAHKPAKGTRKAVQPAVAAQVRARAACRELVVELARIAAAEDDAAERHLGVAA
jgi:hypothetical protein